MHQVQSIDTVDNISVNRQRQLEILEMSVVTQHKFPMIQKVQKTVEILQVQLIDKVVEIFEIMESKDKCQRSTESRGSSQTEFWTFQSC